LRARLGERIRVVVDAANVIGSRPNGWWKDRLGANETLLARLARLSASGVASTEFGGAAGRSWPSFVTVVEGKAKDARGPDPDAGLRSLAPAVRVVRAPGSGDDTIVDEVSRSTPGTTVVVTADRELARRVEEHGVEVRGPSWLLGLLDALPGA
jgi:hypothetical protein